MFGYIKGHEIKNISKRKALKEDFGSEIRREKVLRAIEEKGKVFGLYKKKELVACYVFERQKVKESDVPYQRYDLSMDNIWEFVTNKNLEGNVDVSEVAVSDKEVYMYYLTEQYTKNLAEEIKEQFEKDLLVEFKELLFVEEVGAVVWNDRVLTPKMIKVGKKGYISALPLGLSIGMLFGIVFDELAIGLALGLAWAMAFGLLFSRRKVSE